MKENYINEHKRILDNLKSRGVVETKDGIIDHQKDIFITDGIVCPNTWFGKNDKPKILFLLKEAYTDEVEDVSLIDWLNSDDSREKAINTKTWGPVSQWIYGILNTTVDTKAKFNGYEKVKGLENQYVKEIAIVNIKKSNGAKNSKNIDLESYANADKEYLKAQIELINPDIIVSGNVGKFLNIIFGENKIDSNPENWWHKTELNGKEIIVITGYHPSRRKGTDKEKFEDIINAYHESLN